MPIAYDDQYILRPNHQVNFTREMVMELQKCAMDVEYFAEHFYTIIHPKKGKMLIQLYGFQKQMIRNFANNRFNIVLSARQMGKLLDVETPIITPNGFVKVGDIEEGDVIYGRDGKKAKVTYITDVVRNKKMYNVEFDNGEVIKACSEHLWNVTTSDWERPNGKGEKTVTTDEMLHIFTRLQKRSKPARPFIKTSKPVIFDEKKISIHPYVLGLWLGDGSKSNGQITCSYDDYFHYKEKLSSLGYEVSDFYRDKRTNNCGRFNIIGLCSNLRKYGLKDNKHIPEDYMINSLENRIHLLQGLMDSDGYAEKNGTLQFYQSDTALCDQVRFIIHTLGIKTHQTVKETSHKDCFKITFVCDEYDLFSLERKLKRQHSKKHNNPKNKRHYIVSITETETCPARCIQVDNDEHLFLCGKSLIPTHNTTCSCIYLLWYAIFNTDKDIAILANQQSTAASIVADIKAAYEMLPAFMKPGVKKYDNLTIVFDNGTRVFARATSENALRGESVSLLFLDEFAFVPENIAEGFWAANLPVISTGGDIIVVSTPNGSAGLYYELWKKANAKQTDTAGNTWNPQRIRWDEHPDRDDNWKQEMLGSIGKVRFAQEFDCIFWETPIKIRYNGNIYTVPIRELYEQGTDFLSTLSDSNKVYY